MTGEQLQTLFAKYRLGTLTENERKQLNEWYQNASTDQRRILDESKIAENLRYVTANVIAKTKPHRRLTPFLWKAAIVLFLAAVSLYIYRSQHPEQLAIATESVSQILPASGDATLTLGTGETIVLSETQDEIIIQSDKVYYGDRTAVYNHQPASSANQTECIHTAKGRQYRIVLADGSKVWLNAASTLKYPTRFESNLRKVTLEGEAYFEIARQTDANGSRIPFVVETPTQEIEVLGTGFNVSAYPKDGQATTTLIHGRVRVKAANGGATHELTPGQAVAVKNNGRLQVQYHADTTTVLAWKSRLFRFNQTGIREILSHLSRWYDIDILYEDGMPDQAYYGIIGRDKPLQDVLEVLKAGGVNFRIEKNDGQYQLIVYNPSLKK